MWKDTALRVVSAVVGLVLFFIIVFMDQLVLNIAIGALILFMLFELFHAFGYGWTFSIIGCVGSLIIIAVLSLGNIDLFMGALIVYVLFLVLFAILSHKKTKFSDVAIMFFATIYISCFLVYVSRVRSMNEQGLLFVFLIFICAWACDSGAYFAGKLFGRHKLAPEISPKKTVEGAVGGVVTSIVGCIILGLVSQFYLRLEVNYLFLCIIGLIGAILGQFGDLTASLMKRQCGVKDFGNIMPGHGGVLDRFDSVILVAPFIYYAVAFAAKVGSFIIQ